jgi:5-deoxy-glucuronate isomerase
VTVTAPDPMASPADPRSGHRQAGSLARDGWAVVLEPEDAGWEFSGLRVGELTPGASLSFATGEAEIIVLPLSGAFAVACDDESFALDGRPDVFAGPTDFVYAPPGRRVTVSSPAGGRFAVPAARGADRYAARRVLASDVPVELRGAGVASREIRNFGVPGVLDADRLIACEVLTPGGGWSSFPPHKHDEAGPAETALEEIYYYEVASGPAGPGMAYQRVYGRPGRPIDVLAEVRTGDLVLIPYGWHGPSMAVPGYDLYYLNVMAGPGPERAWRIVDDPAHAWVRETWPSLPVDPRLPFGRSKGRSR